MSKVSYSSISTFNTCPFLYKLRYIDHLETIDDLSASNPLFLGTAIHEGIEKNSVDAAIEKYKENYPEITPENDLVIEYIKAIVPVALNKIRRGEYEVKLAVENEFTGYIDCLVENEDGTYDILDFKCSNNISGYKHSPQVMLYKYYFERTTGKKVRDLYYVFIPKVKFDLKENFDVSKERILKDISSKDIHFEKVEYDPKQINYFFARKTLLEKTEVFDKRYSLNCRWCNFAKYCKTNGVDKSELKVYKEPSLL